ncbi:uncharacterized protein LOC142339368 [Convolutriloba macropyga]|uniref:uncharacterized protein LOC142339368 n=1 Tax=Convolutriloba macropyga TaxID=536237 RepID=UPI003F527110
MNIVMTSRVALNSRTPQLSTEAVVNEKYFNVNLDKVSDIRIFTEELLSDYQRQSKRTQELELIVKQLTSEQCHEKSDERRINLLKMQVLQLERQIQCLYESIKQRTGLISDAATTIDRSCDDLRRYVSQDVGNTEVSVPRKVLIQNVEKLNGVKNQLSHSCHILDCVALGQPVLFDYGSNRRLNSKEQDTTASTFNSLSSAAREPEDLSILDLIVSTTFQQKLDLISLQSLEALVSNAHKSLLATKQAINALCDPLAMFENSTALDCVALPAGKLGAQLSESLQQLELVSSELLLMTFLLPQLNKSTTNPAPAVGSRNSGSFIGASNSYNNNKACFNNRHGGRKRRVIKLQDNLCISQETVYKAFAPHLKTSNVSAVSQVIAAFLECMQLQLTVSKFAKETAENECKFYSSVHEMQVKYQTDLFELIQVAFESFNKDLKRELCDPLADVLTHYERLTQKPTDENLKTFLKVFKQHAEMMTRATYAVLRNDDKGQSAISEFGSAFKESVERLRKKRVIALKDEALALEDAENDWKRFLIYNTILDKENIEGNSSRSRGNDSSRPVTGSKLKPGSEGKTDNQSSATFRSSSVGRMSKMSASTDRINPKEPLPQISPTHAPLRDHGLPVVMGKNKKKKPPRVSAQNPLPDMEF